ncbi:MAG: hypothetical protein WCC53_02195 [Thermoanaerobaculia bacterium]
MDMSIMGCWDCPVPIARALVQAALTLAFLGVMVRFGSAKLLVLRAIGVIGTAVALLAYLVIGLPFVKFGVVWHEHTFLPSRVAQVLVVGPWLAGTAFVLFRLQQSHRRRHAAVATSGV